MRHLFSLTLLLVTGFVSCVDGRDQYKNTSPNYFLKGEEFNFQGENLVKDQYSNYDNNLELNLFQIRNMPPFVTKKLDDLILMNTNFTYDSIENIQNLPNAFNTLISKLNENLLKDFSGCANETQSTNVVQVPDGTQSAGKIQVTDKAQPTSVCCIDSALTEIHAINYKKYERLDHQSILNFLVQSILNFWNGSKIDDILLFNQVFSFQFLLEMNSNVKNAVERASILFSILEKAKDLMSKSYFLKEFISIYDVEKKSELISFIENHETYFKAHESSFNSLSPPEYKGLYYSKDISLLSLFFIKNVFEEPLGRDLFEAYKNKFVHALMNSYIESISDHLVLFNRKLKIQQFYTRVFVSGLEELVDSLINFQEEVPENLGELLGYGEDKKRQVINSYLSLRDGIPPEFSSNSAFLDNFSVLKELRGTFQRSESKNLSDLLNFLKVLEPSSISKFQERERYDHLFEISLKYFSQSTSGAPLSVREFIDLNYKLAGGADGLDCPEDYILCAK